MRFRYLTDPLFVGCVVLYFANRFLIKPLTAGGFFHDHLNDRICIPFWVPIMVFFLRRAGLRPDDVPPRAEEILVPLVMWSAIFELYVPRMRWFEHLATSDFADILYYTIGALLASVVWEITYRDRGRAGGEGQAVRSTRPQLRHLSLGRAGKARDLLVGVFRHLL